MCCCFSLISLPLSLQLPEEGESVIDPEDNTEGKKKNNLRHFLCFGAVVSRFFVVLVCFAGFLHQG